MSNNKWVWLSNTFDFREGNANSTHVESILCEITCHIESNLHEYNRHYICNVDITLYRHHVISTLYDSCNIDNTWKKTKHRFYIFNVDITWQRHHVISTLHGSCNVDITYVESILHGTRSCRIDITWNANHVISTRKWKNTNLNGHQNKFDP